MTTKRSVELEAASAIGGIVKAGIKKSAAFKKSTSKVTGKGKPSKKETSREGGPKGSDSPTPKVEFPNAPKKNPSPAKVGSTRPKPITKGPNATHSISADTGKPVKLSTAQREAVRARESKSSSKPSTPAVNLEDTFTPRQFSVTDKRSSAS